MERCRWCCYILDNDLSDDDKISVLNSHYVEFFCERNERDCQLREEVLKNIEVRRNTCPSQKK